MIGNFLRRKIQSLGRLLFPWSQLEGERNDLKQEIRDLQSRLEDVQRRNEALLHDKFRDLLETPEEAARFVNIIMLGVLRKHHRTLFWGDRLMSMDKAAGFWENSAFCKAYDDIKSSIQYDQYMGPDGIAWRLNTLVWAAQCALQVSGDFVECGVFKGDMSWVVANSVGFAEVPKRFFLYDTFEGFSPQYSSPDDFPLNPNFFSFVNDLYNMPDLFDKVKDRFGKFPNVKVIKGTLPDTLEQESPETIGYLHIDLNSPDAEIGVLDRLFDRVVPGGVIVFDDYGWVEFMKQKRAEDAFMSGRGYAILELPTGQGLVIKR
jgi:O-methyltransferase